MGRITVCSPDQLLGVYGATPAPAPPSVSPAVLAAAKSVMAAGWRVTSIYRPDDGHHAQGIAFDMAPMLYASRSFGPRTAKHILLELLRTGHIGPWLVVSEIDHCHVQLYGANTYGWQPRRGELYITPL